MELCVVAVLTDIVKLLTIMVFCDSFGKSVCFWHKKTNIVQSSVYLGLLFRLKVASCVPVCCSRSICIAAVWKT